MMQVEPDQPANYLVRMADGTVKQVNPFTGTAVWTVPGRGNRPLGNNVRPGQPLDPAQHDAHCAFCRKRMLETPPEKARLVGADGAYRTLRHVMPEAAFDTEPLFRRVPNLFEIVSFDYWAKNYGYRIPPAMLAHRKADRDSEAGRRHLLDRVEYRLRLSGMEQAAIDALGVDEKLALADPFFGGGHEVIIAHRHFIDGATTDSELASSGTLSPPEHYQYFRFTIDAVRDLLEERAQPAVESFGRRAARHVRPRSCVPRRDGAGCPLQ